MLQVGATGTDKEEEEEEEEEEEGRITVLASFKIDANNFLLLHICLAIPSLSTLVNLSVHTTFPQSFHLASTTKFLNTHILFSEVRLLTSKYTALHLR
jgi:hypothetical protein